MDILQVSVAFQCDIICEKCQDDAATTDDRRAAVGQQLGVECNCLSWGNGNPGVELGKAEVSPHKVAEWHHESDVLDIIVKVDVNALTGALLHRHGEKRAAKVKLWALSVLFPQFVRDRLVCTKYNVNINTHEYPLDTYRSCLAYWAGKLFLKNVVIRGATSVLMIWRNLSIASCASCVWVGAREWAVIWGAD